jgi:hypothetical protein
MGLVLACWRRLRRRRVQSGVAGAEVGAAEGRGCFRVSRVEALVGTAAPESGWPADRGCTWCWCKRRVRSWPRFFPRMAGGGGFGGNCGAGIDVGSGSGVGLVLAGVGGK